MDLDVARRTALAGDDVRPNSMRARRVPDDEQTKANRIYYLGLRLSDGDAGEPALGRWSGTVYDQMVPQIRSPVRGLETLPERVLEVIDRVRDGERRLFPPGGRPPVDPEALREDLHE